MTGTFDDIVCSIDDYNRLKLPANYMPVIILGRRYLALIDTGARYSVLGESLYRQWRTRLPDLSPTNVVLSDAQGNGLTIMGKVEIPIQIQHKVVRVPMVW